MKRDRPELDLAKFLGEEDRMLIIQALYALQRERVNAYKVATTVAEVRGVPAPSEDAFATLEVPAFCRRIGAGLLF